MSPPLQGGPGMAGQAKLWGAESTVQLECKHCFHDQCIRGWTIVGKKVHQSEAKLMAILSDMCPHVCQVRALRSTVNGAAGVQALLSRPVYTSWEHCGQED